MVHEFSYVFPPEVKKGKSPKEVIRAPRTSRAYEELTRKRLEKLKECLDKITDLLGECDVLLTQLGAYKTREELRRAHETIEKIRGRVWEALQKT